MNQETTLKLQAYLDNELSPREAEEMAASLEQDAEARVLLAELKEVRTVLVQNEPEYKLPEPREFYWSKIERAIQRETQAVEPAVGRSGYSWWRRILAPAMGAAFLLAATMSIVKLSWTPAKATYVHEIETPLADTTAISFYSQSAGMTVVWVQSNPSMQSNPF